MAFDSNSFKTNPITYLGSKQFVTPGSTGSLTDKSITERESLGGMEVATFNSYTSRKDFAVSSTAPYVATIATGSGFKAYWLPWKSGCAFKMQIDTHCDFFVTAKMNSCGVIIGGDAAKPVIIHANTEDVTVPEFSLDPKVYAAACISARATQINEYKLAYGNFAAEAIGKNWFGTGSPNVSVIDPEYYMNDKLMSMSVFGCQRSGRWTFYANLHIVGNTGKTVEIWPNQPTTLPSI